MPNEMDTSVQPDGPKRPSLDGNDPRTQLVDGVRAALMTLPGQFEFEHPVSGVAATDLFNLNTFLGAGIELEVVRTLNAMRPIWDADGNWKTYTFERSNQSFPDVRLVDQSSKSRLPVALGIELKGWWMLSKEGVPSLRFQVSRDACSPFDLICVVPWYLSSAVSGRPEVAEPWVESARFAAEWRDFWWVSLRESKTDKSLIQPENVTFYPTKSDRINVRPVSDSGNNFGRLPRAKPLMDDFIERTMRIPVLGIPTEGWVKFLKIHKDGSPSEKHVLDQLSKELETIHTRQAPAVAERILGLVRELVAIFD